MNNCPIHGGVMFIGECSGCYPKKGIQMTLPDREKNCTSHHSACGCREYKFELMREEIKKLREALDRARTESSWSFCRAILTKTLTESKERFPDE